MRPVVEERLPQSQRALLGGADLRYVFSSFDYTHPDPYRCLEGILAALARGLGATLPVDVGEHGVEGLLVIVAGEPPGDAIGGFPPPDFD